MTIDDSSPVSGDLSGNLVPFANLPDTPADPQLDTDLEALAQLDDTAPELVDAYAASAAV